jgi:hypothetical protein
MMEPKRHPLLRWYLSDLVVFVLVAGFAVIAEMAREGYWTRTPFLHPAEHFGGWVVAAHLGVVALTFFLSVFILNLQEMDWRSRSATLVISITVMLVTVTLIVSPWL